MKSYSVYGFLSRALVTLPLAFAACHGGQGDGDASSDSQLSGAGNTAKPNQPGGVDPADPELSVRCFYAVDTGTPPPPGGGEPVEGDAGAKGGGTTGSQGSGTASSGATKGSAPGSPPSKGNPPPPDYTPPLLCQIPIALLNLGGGSPPVDPGAGTGASDPDGVASDGAPPSKGGGTRGTPPGKGGGGGATPPAFVTLSCNLVTFPGTTPPGGGVPPVEGKSPPSTGATTTGGSTVGSSADGVATDGNGGVTTSPPANDSGAELFCQLPGGVAVDNGPPEGVAIPVGGKRGGGANGSAGTTVTPGCGSTEVIFNCDFAASVDPGGPAQPVDDTTSRKGAPAAGQGASGSTTVTTGPSEVDLICGNGSIPKGI